jgi:hypothetical protein
MRLSCGLMDGLTWEASLQESDGRPVVVLSNEEILLPADAEFGEFSVLEATAAERAALTQAGYSMPDWIPAVSPGCAVCCGEQPDADPPSEDEPVTKP